MQRCASFRVGKMLFLWEKGMFFHKSVKMLRGCAEHGYVELPKHTKTPEHTGNYQNTLIFCIIYYCSIFMRLR